MNLLDQITLTGLFDFSFPPEWLKAALVLSFFSTGVVIVVFAYLNRFTRKSYFNLWMAGWVFFALWLAVTIQQEEAPEIPLLVWVRRACIGVSALCMFWGSFELTGASKRSRRELVFAIVMVVIWGYLAAYRAREPFWITVPMFTLLAGASVFTGGLYYRLRHRYSGAGMLAVGFILFGLVLLSRPFLEHGPAVSQTFSYVAMSALAVFIALGMVVQVLEQGREQNETLVEEFKRGMATRRLLEQEVTISEQKYRALFDSASDAIFLVDLETLEILEANQSAVGFMGENPSQQTGRNFLDLCPSLRSSDGTLLQNKRMFDEVLGPSKDFLMMRPNGVAVACEGSVNLVQVNKRPVLQLNIREISERKRLEQQLRQAEKLSALGQLVAGVAHELNNPLAVIMGYSQILAKQSAYDPKVKGEVLKILHESERAAKLVRNLLTFARPRDPQMTTVDLNRLIAGVLETHESELESAAIELHTHLAPDLPTTIADPHQIEQVLTNLVMNAVQALKDHNGVRAIQIDTEVHDRMLRISVRDTGRGIAPEIVSRIFDPFFTTKAPGKGTGLGLSISHSIIHEHQGKIWVHSEQGKGATFCVELPLVSRTTAEEFVPATAPAAKPARDPRASAYRLLLVDDEPGILEVLSAVLGDQGYSVDTANNGTEAIERISQHRYDLIVSDLCMPGVDGEALYKHVRESNPALARKMIFVTGDTVSAKTRTFLEWTGNRWFGKPFNIAEIEDVVGNFLCQETLPVA